MSVGELCNREVVIAERTLPVTEAARLMRSHHVGDLVGVNPDALKVGDIMGPEVATVREGEGLFEALRYMRDKGVRRMPVVDGSGGLVGILTQDDLLGLLAEEMTELAKLVSHERQREASGRT